jgi:hypothetical protein
MAISCIDFFSTVRDPRYGNSHGSAPAASNEQRQHGLRARRLLDGSAEKGIYLTSSYQKRF